MSVLRGPEDHLVQSLHITRRKTEAWEEEVICLGVSKLRLEALSFSHNSFLDATAPHSFPEVIFKGDRSLGNTCALSGQCREEERGIH